MELSPNGTSLIGESWEGLPGNSSVFLDGFVSSFSVTVLAELGDRTFFIAAILAVNHSRLLVFLGQMIAQGIMTVASVALGFAAHFIPRYVTHYLSIALFTIFGAKLLYDIRDWLRCRASKESSDDEDAVRCDLESSKEGTNNRRWLTSALVTAFTMTLVAEWGDRSQISTILLSATKDLYAVTLGTLIGHALCTILAVMAGRAIAAYIPVSFLTLVGAILFFGFAIAALIQGYEQPPESVNVRNGTQFYHEPNTESMDSLLR